MKNAIESMLKTRTTEQLKNDAKVAMLSNEDGAIVVFCAALNELETRLTAEQYEEFENSLHE